MSNPRRLAPPPNDDAMRAADAAVAEDAGGRPLTSAPEDAELRSKWMDAYVAAGGKVEEVKPAGKRPDSVQQTCKDKPLLTVSIVSLTFTCDHGLLTDRYSASTAPGDELDRWQPGGKRYADMDAVEWSFLHNDPISQTRKTELTVIAEFEAGPPDAAPAAGTIEGTSTFWNFKGSANFYPTNERRTNTIKAPMTATPALRDRVCKQVDTVTWKVTACGREYVSTSGPHTVYVTYGAPRAEDDQPYIDAATNKPVYTAEPLGITLKRMDTAVALVERVDTIAPPHIEAWGIDSADPTRTAQSSIALDRPHAIVHGLMKKLPGYVLDPVKRLHHFMHPGYMSPYGGAWPMADYLRESGECQAIVRFVRDIILQVGLPGAIETKYVFADPASPYTAKESDDGNAYTNCALVDQPVTAADIGSVYPPSHTRLGGGKTSMGFNNFEACMKFTSGGISLYYGGGAGVYTDKDAVLRAFCALVEVEPAWYKKDFLGLDLVLGHRVTKILAQY
jgi:hypothetical protein